MTSWMFGMHGRTSQEKLVADMKQYGELHSEKVAAVLRSLDRRNYCPEGTSALDAYADSPLPIGHGQTISAPHMHAMCLELLEDHLHRCTAALDVGSGSGYFTAAMALLSPPTSRVFGIDRIQAVASYGRANIANDKPDLLASGRLEIICADGWTVAASDGNVPALFEAIHVGAAAESVPSALTALLAPGGRMVIPVGPEHGDQQLVSIDRSEDGHTLTQKTVCGVRFVPLVRPSLAKI